MEQALLMKSKPIAIVAASLLFQGVMLLASRTTVSKSPLTTGTPLEGIKTDSELVDNAHHYLKLVVKGYPFTSAGGKAEQKIKAFQ